MMVAWLALLPGLLTGPVPPLVYPLDHPPAVTSTFGTYRISHHHAGLDLVTGGSEHVAVRAAADGEVYRIKRNSVGYGRAIYIRHPGGWQTVYAHLSSFAPALAHEVHARAGVEGDLRVAFNLKTPIPVTAGQVLGTVGTSGTDLVHLHFELRKGGSPVNPLTHGLPVPDTQPPRVARLLAIPVAPSAHVNQAHDAALFSFHDNTLAEPVRVSGDVRLLVEVPDRIDGSERDLTPHSVELRIDGKRWHLARYDLVSYADMRQTELDFEPGRQAAREGLFNKLYGEGPRVRVHVKPGRSLKSLRRGDHAAQIIARDAAGHATTATFTLRVEAPAPPCVVKRARLRHPKRPGAPTLPRVWRGETLVLPVPTLCDARAARVDVRLNGRRLSARQVRATRLDGKPALALTVPSDKDATIDIGTAPADGPATWVRIEAFAVKAEAEIKRGPVALDIGKDALFFDYPSEVWTAPNPGGDGLAAVSPLYRFANTWRPAKGYNVVRLKRTSPEADGPHVGVYLHDRGQFWRLGGLEKGDWLQAGTVHLGDLALMRDVQDPVIGEAYLDDHPAGPRLVVPITEKGAGLAQVTLTVDGRTMPVELQRAFDRALWLPGRRPAPGPHVIDVTARDRSGRTASKTMTVIWPDPSAPDGAHTDDDSAGPSD